MPLDFPATADALWSITDACGVRPEYVIPVMYVESASGSKRADGSTIEPFTPGIHSLAGLDYWGLIQANGPWLASRGIDKTEMKNWLASREIAEVVKPWLCEAVQKWGPLRSGARVYQSIFMPASCKYAPGLYNTICSEGSDAYRWNQAFDADKKGRITPADLGQSIVRASKTPAVQDALAQTYARRPTESPKDPAWGTDFIAGSQPNPPRSERLQDWAAVFTIAGAVATAWVALAK